MLDFLGGVFVMVMSYYGYLLFYKEQPSLPLLAMGAVLGRAIFTLFQ